MAGRFKLCYILEISERNYCLYTVF